MIDTGTSLIGRSRERASVDAFLAAGEATVLLVDGEAGIGKTALGRHAVAAAETSGRRVLRCAPTRAEEPLPFAALADLLDPVYDDVAERLAPEDRTALDLALLRTTA